MDKEERIKLGKSLELISSIFCVIGSIGALIFTWIMYNTEEIILAEAFLLTTLVVVFIVVFIWISKD